MKNSTQYPKTHEIIKIKAKKLPNRQLSKEDFKVECSQQICKKGVQATNQKMQIKITVRYLFPYVNVTLEEIQGNTAI